MSELGNKLKYLRERMNLTQAELADQTELSPRTIANIEEGDRIRKETVLEIIKKLKLPHDQGTEMLLAWIKSELGPDAERFWIEPRSNSAEKIKDQDNLAAKVVSAINSLPVRWQNELLAATTRPEILRSVAHLNKLHQSLKPKS